MELKDYQVAALEAFVRWRDALAEAQDRSQDETIAIAQEDAGPRRSRRRTATTPRLLGSGWCKVRWRSRDRRPVREPHGRCRTAHPARLLQGADRRRQDPDGRRRVAAAQPANRPHALDYADPRHLRADQGAPSGTENIPYRQILEQASGGRVKLLEKDDPFTRGGCRPTTLCVMLLMLPAANRQKGQRVPENVPRFRALSNSLSR